MAQEKGIVTGKLLDKEMNNEPLSFASVVIKGTVIGTETDLEGNFSLSVNSGSYVLVFNFLAIFLCKIKSENLLFTFTPIIY